MTEPVDITEPRFIWSDKNIKEARALLSLRYDDILPSFLWEKLRSGAPVTAAEERQVAEAVQVLLDVLIQKWRNDPVQIERVIVQHFRKKK
ncbi:MAG: hypothetical protein Q8M94_20740 [Ignavibacteria bacterium]|nr:hypothetical protein [Ignavibacteria bacterium]